MFSSREELTEGLRNSGYIVDSVTANTVHLASALHKPVLLEGPAGSGMTQLAYAVADAARTIVERLQCYQGISEDKAIGKFDESLQQLCVDLKAKSTSVEWDGIQIELHGRRFFSAGPLLRALEYKNPCVLLIDELDKVDHAFEAMLLELLSAWQLSIPKLGTVKAERIPFVVLTSNEESASAIPCVAAVSICALSTRQQNVRLKLVRLRTPDSSREFHAGMAGLAKALRGWSLEKPPSISEILDLAQALKVLGEERVTPEMRDLSVTPNRQEHLTTARPNTTWRLRAALQAPGRIRPCSCCSGVWLASLCDLPQGRSRSHATDASNRRTSRSPGPLQYQRERIRRSALPGVAQPQISGRPQIGGGSLSGGRRRN